MRDGPERDDGAQAFHLGDGVLQERSARRNLDRQRFVLRRHATHRISDAAVNESQAVISRASNLPLAKTVAGQRVVEQIAGEIAGKRSPGAVCSPERPGAKANDQKPGFERPERWHRRIEPVRMSSAAFLTIGDETRAKGAIAARFALSGQSYPAGFEAMERAAERTPYKGRVFFMRTVPDFA